MAYRFSVAMCTYNGARFVGGQLESIAAQTRPPDELVVCDDRSSDETVSAVERFAREATFPVRLSVNERNLGSTKNFERAISQAETYLGIVEHYKLAAIVGSPTAGTNGNINPFTLPGGYLVWWTGMKVLKHDGSRHHGVGIQPTVPVARTIQGVARGRDEVLERAIKLIEP